MRKFIFYVLSVSAIFIFASCGKTKSSEIVSSSQRTIIWTSCAEIAQYIELFNRENPNSNAILVYKANPAEDLPPARDERTPDVVIGPYLRSEKMSKNFRRLDFLFDRQIISSNDFYPQLIEAGKKNTAQYLLPVSFNLPLVMFLTTNKSLIENNYTLTLEDIKKISSSFNKKKSKDAYIKMGFTPLSYPDFMYLVTKLYGTRFRLEKNDVIYNPNALKNSVTYLRNWSISANTSVQTEDDFAYKYLFMPEYRQIDSERCLFSYTTSDDFFRFMNDDNEQVDYRWICYEDTIPIEDSFLTVGIYKETKNIIGATEFITWFLNSENQKNILERKAHIGLDTDKFGIAGGFSAVRKVNEQILPAYYTKLLSNLPPSQLISLPELLPPKWESYKEDVIHPYLHDAVHSNEMPDINLYIREWQKRILN